MKIKKESIVKALIYIIAFGLPALFFGSIFRNIAAGSKFFSQLCFLFLFLALEALGYLLYKHLKLKAKLGSPGFKKSKRG